MATKQFLTLEGLTTYDGLIKQYIGTEDAKSIKSLTVSGNTVSFYKTADASGTAAYTVNMPDVSGFMSKIEEPAAGSILVSDANGNAVEDESLTGYAVLQSLGATTGFDGSNTIADALDDLMPKGDWALHGYVVGTSTNGEVYDTQVGVGALENAIAATAGFDDQNTIADAIDSISSSMITGYHLENAEENELVAYHSGDGDAIQPTGITIDDIATQEDLANKIDKIASATGGKLVTSTSAGQVAESGTAISDLATQSDIASFLTGYNYTNSQDKILISHGDPTEGDIEVSTIDIDDIATQTDLSGKMSKGPWNNNTGRIVLTAENGEVDYGSKFGMTDSDELFAWTGYALNPTAGDIPIFGSGNGGDLITSSHVALSDLATKAFVGSIPQGASASTVVGYIDEAVADAAADADISLVEAQTPTTGYLKTYELYQGGNAAANLVGKIDIPKDLVVTSGEIVVNPTGQPAGTYLKLTIANQTEPVYINVADLCDVYTAQQSAAQVQLAISATNEISATIVAGSVTATELASNAVTTAKIADGNVTKAKLAQGVQDSLDLADSAVQSVAEGATNGTIAVDGTDVAVHGLGSAAYTASTAYATSAQGALADTALQPADVQPVSTSDIEALFS